jgi:hypothetical protein
MKRTSTYPRSSATTTTARISRCGRMPVLVGFSAGLSLLFLLGAFVGVIDPESAIRGGAALVAVGGIGAFLVDD